MIERGLQRGEASSSSCPMTWARRRADGASLEAADSLIASKDCNGRSGVGILPAQASSGQRETPGVEAADLGGCTRHPNPGRRRSRRLPAATTGQRRSPSMVPRSVAVCSVADRPAPHRRQQFRHGIEQPNRAAPFRTAHHIGRALQRFEEVVSQEDRAAAGPFSHASSLGARGCDDYPSSLRRAASGARSPIEGLRTFIDTQHLGAHPARKAAVEHAELVASPGYRRRPGPVPGARTKSSSGPSADASRVRNKAVRSVPVAREREDDEIVIGALPEGIVRPDAIPRAWPPHREEDSTAIAERVSEEGLERGRVSLSRSSAS